MRRYSIYGACALLGALVLAVAFYGPRPAQSPGASKSSTQEPLTRALSEASGAEAEAAKDTSADAGSSDGQSGDSGGASANAHPDRVIVKFRAGSSATARGNVRSQERVQKIRDLGLIQAELVKAVGRSPQEAARALSRRPEVEYAEPDYVRQRDGYKDEPRFKELWGLHNTGQTVQGVASTGDVDVDGLEASAVTLGKSSLVVAVIDDGVDFSHPDLSARRWVNPGESGTKAGNGVDDDGNGYVDDVNGWDFHNGDNTVYDAADGDAHGTHVAGTIAGSVNGQGIVGVAPNVKIMGLKFIGPEGGFTSDAISAIQYAKQKGVVISNNSWGGPGYSQALKDAIEASGQLFVAAAGNSSKNQDTNADPDYPAAYSSPNILAVAAVDSHGNLASFSNYGATSVDMSAPGVNILSSVPGGYAYYSGTSMATPHVTGVAALARSVNSGLSPAALRSIILDSGKPAAQTVGKTATGKIVDARAALSRADTTPPSARAPVQSFPVPGALGTTTVPVRLAWPVAADSGSGVARYQLQQGTNGAYKDVPLSSATARSKLVSLAPGANKYVFRVRAYDRVGNESTWATGPTFTVGAYQEGSAVATYSGTWHSGTLSGAYGGSVKSATAADTRVTFTFSGRNVAWVSTKSTNRGKADVYLDGAKVATVDLYSDTTRARQLVFTRAVAPSTTHKLEVRVLGTSGRPGVDVDAFVVVR